MTREKKLRVGVIGLGVGARHIAGYEEDPRCEVVALCDIDREKLANASLRYPNLRVSTNPLDILVDETINAVSIATYDDVHAEQVVIAVEHGKHVFVEKPLCQNQCEFDNIVNCLNANRNVKMSTNFILRKTPRFIELRRRIQNNRLGNIYYLEGDYDYGRLNKLTEGWRSKIPTYSVTHGGAIHLIDLEMWLTGKRVREVFAYGTDLATKDTNYCGYDMVTALLSFEDGLIGKISANFGSVTPHHHKVCVYGTLGAFNQGHMGAMYSFTRVPNSGFETVDDPYPNTDKGDMLPTFVKSILDLSEPDVTTQEMLDTMAVSLAVEASLTSQQPETVCYATLN